MRRLADAGLLRDTRERTTGRGRIGSYFALDLEGIGSALAVDIAPRGVVAEALDAQGSVRSRAQADVPRPARPADVRLAVSAVCRRAGVGHRFRLATVSAADPVDRTTGRLVHLPDSPFLVGELSPADLLASFVDGPVTVDNEVNWAARAERTERADEPDDFAYLYLDEGFGCAVVTDAEVRRGGTGLAG